MEKTCLMALLVSFILCGLPPANALVRDSVEIGIQGQTRVLRLVTDDPRVESGMPCGANPTGVTLRGHFRVEMTKPNGNVCGKLEIGELFLEHGRGWDRRKVLTLGDWNGDGHRWEVLYYAGDAVSNGYGRGMIGFDPRKGALRKVMFRSKSGSSPTMWGLWDPKALRYERPFLRCIQYDNSFQSSNTGYSERRYRWDPTSFCFVLVERVAIPEPADLWYPES